MGRAIRCATTVAFAAIALSSIVRADSPPLPARIHPPDPVEFERVALRRTVDSCVFDETRVRVFQENATIVVVEPQNACLLPGPIEVVDIQLGAFPAGAYDVEVRFEERGTPVHRVEFEVTPVVYAAVFPPPPHPIANHTGVWWSSGEAGWGLSLHQGILHGLFGALFVFDEAGAPAWYTLQSGQWQSSTRWVGEVLRTSGPPWVSSSIFDASLVSHAEVGAVVLDFTMTPGHEDGATLSLTIGGTTVTKTITRLRL